MAEGLSRRDMIKGAAVAGAAAWTAPMIIDSLTSPAAAGSGCQPAAALAISGATAIFTIGAGSTVYWTSFASGATVCASSASVPSDSDFASAVSACGGTIQVTGGAVKWNGSVPTYTPGGAIPCYFAATANGVTVNAAGITASVHVLAYVLHNGSFSGCTEYGSKGHWAIVCGSSNPQCGQTANCI